MVFLKTPRSSHKHGLPGSCSSPLMSPYLPRRSHWDNCAPIMEKLVGPEMSLSRCSLVSLGSVKPWRAAEEEEEEAPPLPGVLHKSAFTACLSSLLRCLCLLLQYHFNFALQVFYENTKWNKKRHGCSGLLICSCEAPFQTCWGGALQRRGDLICFEPWVSESSSALAGCNHLRNYQTHFTG